MWRYEQGKIAFMIVKEIHRTLNTLFSLNDSNLRAKRTQSLLFTKKPRKSLHFHNIREPLSANIRN